MTSRVLVPIDSPETAERTLEFALASYPEAEITVLHIVGTPTWHMGAAAGLVLSEGLPEAVAKQTEEVFERARDLAATHDTEITTLLDAGNPSDVIVRQAKEFDIVVLKKQERDLSSRLLVGNIEATVTRRSPVPVTVVG
jgi:nucleotide-binding universal stress UspA family protein